MNNIHSILMVRPSSFRMNSQTASNNYFQKNTNLNDAQVLEKACIEFDNLVSLLISNGIWLEFSKNVKFPLGSLILGNSII